MPLSSLSQRLLRMHAARPDHQFYGVRALGSMFPESDLALLDAAYDELVKEGLIAKSNDVVSYFGRPTPLYAITDEGAKHAAREVAV